MTDKQQKPAKQNFFGNTGVLEPQEAGNLTSEAAFFTWLKPLN